MCRCLLEPASSIPRGRCQRYDLARATLLGVVLQCLVPTSEYRQYTIRWYLVYRALLAARVASASIASASALNARTSGSGIAHLHMACLHNLLHAPHFACLEPDLDAARVEGGFRQIPPDLVVKFQAIDIVEII